MKICLYTETALPQLGGQELVVDALARQFLAQGHEVAVLAPFPRHRLKLTVDDRSFPYRVARHWRFWSTWRKLRWYRHRLLWLHRTFPFEVLHCHSIHPCGYLGALCKDELDAPLVITSHGGSLEPGSTHLQKPGATQRYGLALQRADALVAISPFTRNAMEQMAATAPIVDIPNGVDYDSFATACTRPQEIDPAIQAGQYVLFIGRLHVRKGVDLLLDAWARVSHETATTPKLVIAGAGEERRRLIEQAKRLGIGRGVHFVGTTGGSVKTWLLQNARFVCTPSRDWEAFPLVVLEAFAAGKPVVGTRVPGLETIIQPGKVGWLSPAESPVLLAQTIRSVLSAPPELMRQLGANAREVAQRHRWDRVAASYLQLFAELVESRPLVFGMPGESPDILPFPAAASRRAA